MYGRAYLDMHIYIYVCVYIHIHVMCVCVHIMYAHCSCMIYIYMYRYVHVCVYINEEVSKYIHMYICMYIYIHIYTHTLATYSKPSIQVGCSVRGLPVNRYLCWLFRELPSSYAQGETPAIPPVFLLEILGRSEVRAVKGWMAL